MSYAEYSKPAPASWLDIAFVSFLRLLAICFIGFTIQYWMRVSGYYAGPEWRFDTMSPAWKIVAAMLSVLLPIAAVGLWSTLSWGRVVWAMVAITELTMHAGFPEYFGTNTKIVWFHLAAITIYLVFQGGFIYSTKKA
jgi:hypothetical protein